MRRLTPVLLVALALAACKSDPPAAEPAVAAEATAPADSSAPDGAGMDDQAMALLGTWECTSGVPAAQVTFALGDDGSRSAMLSPMTGDASDDHPAMWTLEPALLTLESPEGTVAYHRFVVEGDDLSGMNGEEPFACSRLGGG